MQKFRIKAECSWSIYIYQNYGNYTVGIIRLDRYIQAGLDIEVVFLVAKQMFELCFLFFIIFEWIYRTYEADTAEPGTIPYSFFNIAILVP